MFCYFPGTTITGVGLGALLWWAHRTIFAIVAVIWHLTEYAAIAILATSALILATGVVAFIEWTARLIRRHQAARGACLTCPHPCQQAQVVYDGMTGRDRRSPSGRRLAAGKPAPVDLSTPMRLGQ